MTRPVRYVRRPHAARNSCFEYLRAYAPSPWLHVGIALLIVLAVLAGAAFAGYWSPFQ